MVAIMFRNGRPQGMRAAVRSSCAAVADLLRNHDASTTAVIEAVDLDAIANHLRGGAYDAIGPDVSPILSDSFDDLFGVAARKDFPAAHSRHGWAIIGPNPFKVAVGGGLHPSTHAEVWWRA